MLLTLSFYRWEKGGTEQVNELPQKHERRVALRQALIGKPDVLSVEVFPVLLGKRGMNLSLTSVHDTSSFKMYMADVYLPSGAQDGSSPLCLLALGVRHTGLLWILISWLRQLHPFIRRARKKPQGCSAVRRVQGARASGVQRLLRKLSYLQ